MTNPSDDFLEAQRLQGELSIQRDQYLISAESEHVMKWFWRSLYLKEHPELDNWEKVEEMESEEWDKYQREKK